MHARRRKARAPLADHTRTNIATIQRFQDVAVQVHAEVGRLLVDVGDRSQTAASITVPEWRTFRRLGYRSPLLGEKSGIG